MNNVALSTNTAPVRAFTNFTQPKNGWYLPVENTEEDKKKEHHYAKTLVIGSLVVGFGTLAMMKGSFGKTLTKYLDKWKVSLEKKSIKTGKLQSFYRYSLGKVTSFLEKTQSINNLTSLKDVLFQKLMFGKNGERTFTKKIHEGITRFFDKIARKTVNSSYAKTHKKFASLNEYMTSTNERLLKDNPKNADAIRNINERLMRVNTALNNGFGINARNARLRQMNEASDGLYERFWNASFSDIKNFKAKEMWQSFIADGYLLPAKMRMGSEVGVLRQAITHDINDSYKASIKAIEDIQKFINPKDISSNEILEKLRQSLDTYKKLSGKDEIAQRTVLNDKIITDLNSLVSSFKISGSSPEAQKAVSSYVAEVENIISKSSKGELQEILTAYKEILPRNEYLKLKAQVNSAVKSLDNSIETETVQYFDKARDLKLGSAPTDILSILFTVGTVGWFLGKSKDKDERVSASLKYGIPAIGAIATSLLCTAKLISGSKSLAFGLISGWLMNRVGGKVDDLRKKYSLDVSFQNRTILKENIQKKS